MILQLYKYIKAIHQYNTNGRILKVFELYLNKATF